MVTLTKTEKSTSENISPTVRTQIDEPTVVVEPDDGTQMAKRLSASLNDLTAAIIKQSHRKPRKWPKWR